MRTGPEISEEQPKITVKSREKKSKKIQTLVPLKSVTRVNARLAALRIF